MGSADVASEAIKSEPVTASSVEEDKGNGGGEEDSNRQKQPIRKRTKTGCLSTYPCFPTFHWCPCASPLTWP